jgi:hypothetical protein
MAKPNTHNLANLLDKALDLLQDLRDDGGRDYAVCCALTKEIERTDELIAIRLGEVLEERLRDGTVINYIEEALRSAREEVTHA